MKPLGDAFIKVIRMLIAPIIFCTVVHGIVGMKDLKKVGRVALKALIYFEVVTTLALVVGLVLVNLWRPGAGMNVDPGTIDTTSIQSYTSQAGQQSVSEFVVHIIPATIVGAFAEGEILQVLFFSVLFAFALSLLGERGRPLVTMIDLASQVLFRIVAVLRLTSEGAGGVAGAAFVVLASTLSTIGTIPVASIALVLGIHRFMGEAMAVTNLVGNSVATIVIARWEGALDEARMRKLF